MKNLLAKIEQHPLLVSLIGGGVILLATIYFIRSKQGSTGNTSGTGASYSDAAGNVFDSSGNLIGSLTGGSTVSPQMSQTDLSTQLQDFEQSLMNQLTQWEQQQSQTVGNQNGGNSGGPTILPPTGDVGGWSFNQTLGEWVYSFRNMFISNPQAHQPGAPPSGGANRGFWSEWWDNTIGAWVGKWVMPMIPVDPNPNPPPQQIPTPPATPPNPVPVPAHQNPASNQVFATTGVWGQGGNPFTTLWYAWQQYGQPHNLSLVQYENDFMQWNPSVHNPNIIQANTRYRVW